MDTAWSCDSLSRIYLAFYHVIELVPALIFAVSWILNVERWCTAVNMVLQVPLTC